MTAARPPGRLKGMRTLATHDNRMMAKHTRPIHGVSHIWKAGRRAMNVMDTPARVPSMAARGVYLRMVGPMKAPSSTMMPMISAQMSPSFQARMASPVRR